MSAIVVALLVFVTASSGAFFKPARAIRNRAGQSDGSTQFDRTVAIKPLPIRQLPF